MSEELGRHGLPFCRVGNVQQGFDFSGADRYPEDRLNRVGEKVSRPGDVVFTSKGTVGRFAMVRADTETFVYSPQLCYWRSLDPRTIDAGYLYYWMSGPAFREQFRAVAGQTDMAEYVSLGDQRAMWVELPHLREQQRISRILGALDDKIELNQRMATTLVHGVLAQYQRLVGGEDGPLRSVYEVADVVYGAPFSSDLFNESRLGLPLLRIRDLRGDDPGIWTTERHPKGHLVRAGDIVVGMDGEFRAYVWAGEPSWLNQRVCTFLPARGASAAFVYAAIHRPLAQVEATETGTTVIHLGKADIDRFMVPSPPATALARFDRIAQPMLERSVIARREARLLGQIRDALLPRLLSGSLHIQFPDVVMEEAS